MVLLHQAYITWDDLGYLVYRWHETILAILFIDDMRRSWLSWLQITSDDLGYLVYRWPETFLAILFIDDLRRSWLSCLCPFIFLLRKTFKLFGIPIFWLWAYLMNVILKRVMRTNFNIYVFITNNINKYWLVQFYD